MTKAYYHHGWRITEDRRASRSGRFRAVRWGVELRASHDLILCRMIELRPDSRAA